MVWAHGERLRADFTAEQARVALVRVGPRCARDVLKTVAADQVGTAARSSDTIIVIAEDAQIAIIPEAAQ